MNYMYCSRDMDTHVKLSAAPGGGGFNRLKASEDCACSVEKQCPKNTFSLAPFGT